MLLERYYDDSLAQASYVIGCEATREAIVIDPNIVTRYQGTQRIRLRLKYVTETHIHADYLSGSRDVARKTGAELLLSGHGGADWSYKPDASLKTRLIKGGDTIMVGKVRLDVLHTPGHTPEHLSFVVTDTATGDRPMGIITGDFVFVGDVGRPDLLEKAAKVKGTMDASARALFQSLARLSTFADYLQIWPGHGAGSACGKALGSVPQSTLGYERLYNPAFQLKSEDEFVKWVLADQPDPPPYFAIMKRWNRDGHPELKSAPASDVSPNDLDALAGTYQLVDMRSAEDFAAGHVPGAINIPATSKSFATYAGTVLSYDKPILLIAPPGVERERILHGFRMIGLSPGASANSRELTDAFKAGKRGATLKTTTAEVFAKQRNGARIIDVRNTNEWNSGHIPDASHIYLGELASRAAALPKDTPIVVHCQSGVRSFVGASLLKSLGFTDVTSMKDGIDSWRKAGLPLTKD